MIRRKLFGSHVLLVLAIVIAACTAHSRDTAIKDTFVGLNAARDGFVLWDKAHQAQVVASATSVADGETKLAAYTKKRQPVLDGFEAAYTALKLAATLTDDPSLANAAAAALAAYQAAVKFEQDLK